MACLARRPTTEAQRHGGHRERTTCAPKTRNAAFSVLTSVPLCLCGFILGLASGTAQGCTPPLQGDDVRMMRSAMHAVAWWPDPAPIPLGAHFRIELAVCAADGRAAVETIAVDAEMPEHRHGMNYRPSLTPLGGGRYRAEGLLFHMPGRWRLTVE